MGQIEKQSLIEFFAMARMMAGNSKFHDQSLRDQAARLLSALLFPALFIHEREFTPPLTDEITSIL